jgi:hypothetical protein
MGIGEGLIYALAGGAQGGGKAMQENAQAEIKKRDALDTNRALLMQKEEIDQMRQARVAEILQTVKTRMPDATHPEGERDLTPQELAAAKAGALESKGMLGESEKYRLEENRLRDDAQRQKEKADEMLWRERRADIEDKRAEETAKHQRRMDERSAAVAGIALREAKEKEAVRKKVRGLIEAGEAVDMSQPGAKEAREFYRQEEIRAADQGNRLLRAGSAPDSTAFKEKRELAMSYRQEAHAADKEAEEARKLSDTEAVKRAEDKAAKARAEARALFKQIGETMPEDSGKKEEPKGSQYKAGDTKTVIIGGVSQKLVRGDDGKWRPVK